jgi:hypothetical protein
MQDDRPFENKKALPAQKSQSLFLTLSSFEISSP